MIGQGESEERKETAHTDDLRKEAAGSSSCCAWTLVCEEDIA